ncbi:plasma membrane fusion protein PRM1 [Echria macrotheca]|uniref:Plasma membrane fusion protein PRM1 n=1 Tax=Echria macrotheca TaxID=438768 RepID=A0AAJ0B3S7_9PEZI|nr:plasma membrane fusion protein PRM1 [Echria macrotheca]
MSYGEKSRGIPPVPPLPSNLNANSWEMIDLQDGRHPRPDPKLQPHAYTDPSITPYLGLRARLSQIWLNRWTVLLLLVLARVVILTGGLNTNLESAKVKALSACTKVEDIGSAMASMPHYLSVGVNSLAADGISKTVRGLVQILQLILTAVEQLILFVINYYIGTIVCLVGALIHGTLDVSVQAIDGVTKDMNDAIGKISGEISSDLSSIQNTVNGILNGIVGLVKSDPPKIDVTPRLDELKNIKIDTSSFTQGLSALNSTIPTFDQAENFTKNALSIPFKLVGELLDSKFGNYTFDQSVFPVAQKRALSFCSDNSFLNDFFNTLFDIVAKAKIAFAVTLPILAILAMIMMAWIEIRRWRKEKMRAKVFTEHGYDPMDVTYIVSRPITAGAGIKLASRFSGKKNLLARWTIAYMTSLPALFVLSLAMAGFFSCFCQFLMLRAIEKEAPALANQVGDFAGDVVKTLGQVSTEWADDANGVVLSLQNDINDDLLGWVRNATKAVNDTLNTLDEEIDKGITTIFNGTVLLNTARDVVGCIIGRKIDTVEQGLTFINEHAKVTLPLFPNDTFSEGADKSVQGDSDLTSFLATPATVTTDEVSGAVDDVVNMLHQGIVQEALISTALLLVYVIVVLVGVIRSAVGMAGRDKTRAEGGQFYGSQRDNPVADPGAAPAYSEVVYAGNVPRGKAGVTRYPSHARKSSYPEVEDMDR